MATDLKRYAITVMREPMEVYSYWRALENLPQFSPYLKSVQQLDDRRSRWTTEGPQGDISWEAEITEDVPGERLSWRSVESADVKNFGTVEFKRAPGNRGCEVYAEMQADIPAGKLGEMIAGMTGNKPEQQMAETMHRFKTLLECGEIPIIDGQPSDQMRGESETKKRATVR